MIGEFKQQVSKMIQTTGRALLSIKYPRDIESYFITLEVCKGDTDETISFFTFPINPNSFQKKEPGQHNIKKTFGGVVVNDSNDFIPHEISLRGNFGRSFKLLTGDYTTDLFGIGGKSVTEKSTDIVDESSDLTVVVNKTLHSFIKSGFGCLKQLQLICYLSRQGVEVPNKLYFHNYMLGESYLAKVRNLTIDQSLEMNMIYNYNLQLDLIAPSNFIRDNEKSFKRGLLSNVLSETVNKTAHLGVKKARRSWGV